MTAVLIVDDVAANREFLATLLAYKEYRILEAGDGAEALALARSARPDLIITDILMPTMDGYEFVRQLRLDPQLAQTVVIFCTADYREHEAQRLALDCGVAHLLIKPCEPELVLSTVESALGLVTQSPLPAPSPEFDRDHLRLLTDKLSAKAAELQAANQRLAALYAKSQSHAAALEQEAAERKLAQMRLAEQLARLDLLQRITRAIGERQDLRSIFQVVVRSLENDLPIDFGCICLYDPVGRKLTVASVGARGSALAAELAMTENAAVAADDDGLARCVQGAVVYEPDTRRTPLPFPQRLALAGLHAVVAAPLIAESRVFGVLIAARRPAHTFSSSDCEFLRQLSEHVALATHQAQLYAALQRAYHDLRESQQVVMQQERLRALGQMASGVAHDINNSIFPVSLYVDALLEQQGDLSELSRGYLRTIKRAIQDVAQTVARMREFYRPREPQTLPVAADLNRIIEQVVEFTRARWRDVPQQHGAVIELKQDLAADLPEVCVTQSELRDALTNLIFNAVDAMPGGGTLTLRTQAGVSRAAAPAIEAVLLEVSDTGVGMDEETRRRCLEPFFTTKGERGTGMGLAMVYGMAQRYEAAIDIQSRPGHGTTIDRKSVV